MGYQESPSSKTEKLKIETTHDELRLESLHSYSVDIDTRKIYLMEEIEGDPVSTFLKDLHYLESKDPKKPIYLYVSSPGGSVDQMFLIYDSLKNCSCPIVTVGSGGIYSAAGLILVSGTIRLATENAFFMSHQTQNLIAGADNEIEAQVEIGKKMKDRFWKIMADNSSLPAKTWQKNAINKGEIWYDAEEMLKYRIIDEILKPGEDVQKVTERLLSQKTPNADSSAQKPRKRR